MNRFYSLKLLTGGNVLELFVNSGLAVDYAIAFPSTAPSDGQILKSDGSGNLSWETLSAGGGTGTPSSTYTLNNDFTTGTPVDDGVLGFLRGDQSTAIVKWDEGLGRWVIGTEASSKPIGRIHRQTFTSADVVTGSVTITHNLAAKPIVQIINNNGVTIGLDISHTSDNAFTIDVSRAGTLTGSWTAIATS